MATLAIPIGWEILAIVGSAAFAIMFTAKTAQQIISERKLGSIMREFPSQCLNWTPEKIEEEAKKGNACARKAKKLLNDKRFDK